MSLFESMLELASNMQVKTLNTKHPLLTGYLDDVNVRDRDVVKNDMQAGDSWLWVLKSNGCGTYLLLLDGNIYNGFDQRMKEEGTAIFLITVTGDDEGKIKPISAGTAIGMTHEVHHKPNRVPKRVDAYSVFTEFLDLKAMGVQLSDTRFWSDYSVSKGDVSYLKLSKSGTEISFVVNRVVFTLNSRGLKSSLYYKLANTDKLRDLLFNGDKFFKFTASDDFHGAIEEVTLEEYEVKTKLLIAA